MNLLQELESLAPDLEKGLAQACSLPDLDELRVVFLGRKGKLAGIMSRLPSLPAEERPDAVLYPRHHHPLTPQAAVVAGRRHGRQRRTGPGQGPGRREARGRRGDRRGFHP